MAEGTEGSTPSVVQEAVLVKSEPMPPEYSTQVKGYEFSRDKEVDYHGLLQSFRTSGFQATNFGLAVEQITMMVHIMYIMYTQPYCGWLALLS